MNVKKQSSEPNAEQWNGSKLGKEDVRLYFVINLFNLFAEYIMQNAGLDKAQAEIKIAGKNINNLRYSDDTILWQKGKKN